MLFFNILRASLLATIALASPLHHFNNTLSRREDNDGQAGGYILARPGVSFRFVYGTVTMPDISNADMDSKVSYWIGIDGYNTDRVIQAGLDAVKRPDGSIYYQAFTQWYGGPNNAAKYISFSDFSASQGDEVSITVTIASGRTLADASFVNKNTGQSFVEAAFHSPGEDYDAEGINAMWVMEWPPESPTLARFSDIVFTNCAVADQGGFEYLLDGGGTLDLVRLGVTYARGTILGNNVVDIHYSGP